MQALGNDPDKLNVDIIQMVRLVSDGKEAKYVLTFRKCHNAMNYATV